MKRLLYITLLFLVACHADECKLTGLVVLQDGDRLTGCHVDGEVWIVGHDIKVQNVTIDATGQDYGILIRPGSSLIEIDGAKVWGAKQAGISCRDWQEKSVRDVVIRNSLVFDCKGDPKYTENHSGSGIFLEGCQDCIVENCEAFGNGELSNSRYKNGPVGIWAAASDNVTFINCTSHHNRSRPGHADGGGFDFDGGTTNSRMINCHSWENTGPGFLVWEWKGGAEIVNVALIGCSSVDDKQALLIGGNAQGTGGPEQVRVDSCLLVGRVAYDIRTGKDISITNSELCGQMKTAVWVTKENNRICNTEL